MKRGSKLCIQIATFILILAAISAVCLYLTARGYTVKFLQWIMHAGIRGHAVMIGCFILAALPLPSAFLYGSLVLGAGFIYGLWMGTLSVVVGSFIGLFVTLVSCRPCGRKWLEELVQYNKHAAALMRALDQFGIRVIFLLRMTPLPQSLQNAVIALSSVPYSHAMLAATLGALPEQFLGVYIGSTLRDLHELLVRPKHSKVHYVFVVVELVAVILLFCLISCMAKRALEKLEQEEEEAAEILGSSRQAGNEREREREGERESSRGSKRERERDSQADLERQSLRDPSRGAAAGAAGAMGTTQRNAHLDAHPGVALGVAVAAGGRNSRTHDDDDDDHHLDGHSDGDHGSLTRTRAKDVPPSNYSDADVVEPQEQQPLLHRPG